jgi:hypothetical protein
MIPIILGPDGRVPCSRRHRRPERRPRASPGGRLSDTAGPEPAPAQVLTPAALAAALDALTQARAGGKGGTRVIAIDGWSGSGKTSLAEHLAPALGAACLHLDDWVPGWHGLARSVELLVEWVLQPLALGRPARWRPWNWARAGFDPWEVVAPAELIVVEGCGAGSALARPWLTAQVWISIDDDERARRLHARPDWATYAPWADMWAAQEAALRAGEDPPALADAVVEVGSETPEQLQVRWAGP